MGSPVHPYVPVVEFAGHDRLQDWARVKNHVFTIYSTVRDTSVPPVTLRTQVTVDRTRCLYTNDLPARISEIEPIGYYNAVND